MPENPPHPSEDDIRAAILRRADEFARITGTTVVAIGKAALNDNSFITDVRNGRNFTIRSYRLLMDWLDKNWPPDSVPAPDKQPEPITTG